MVPDPVTGMVKPGRTIAKTFRLEGNLVRRLAAPGSKDDPEAHPVAEEKKDKAGKKRSAIAAETPWMPAVRRRSADGVDDGLLLVVAELGVDGQGEDFGGGLFGVGEVAGFVAEVFERGLQVERDGIVDLAADAQGSEMVAELVAAWRADDVLVEDVGGARIGPGQHDALASGSAGEACTAEKLIVAGCERRGAAGSIGADSGA